MDMDGKNFLKLCKDSGIVGKAITPTEASGKASVPLKGCGVVWCG
jgi:hypothetical protein